ncbi:MAG: hypothetical protein KJ950_14940 [Proteobacteria bacterium]|nr:hypothetical protein [Pseudomonadota bacterium]MBU1688631.1 hypothetical protein [Pseudomonadota bacterium]
MKLRLFLLSAAVFLYPLGATVCFADYQDLTEQVSTEASVWIGGYGVNSDATNTSSRAENDVLPEASGRAASPKAGEYYSPDSSPSGGFFFATTPLPNRYHFEFDYYNQDEWYGDFRYAFKDILQIRLLPRRFYHQLDNLTVFDFAPTSSSTAEVDNRNPGAEYGLQFDLDLLRMRLKTPNYPFHVYGEAELVKRTGTQQLRFLGGSGNFYGGTQGGRVRVTESRSIDQENKVFTIGTSTHIGLIEVDLSHKNRNFENSVADPTYAYQTDFIGGTTASVHNVIPNLKATTNTVKIHTAHSGKVFASATYSMIDKTNETSGAKAENTMGYGEVFWLPAPYLSFAVKYRHQENEASAPSTVSGYDQTGVLKDYAVNPGVISKTDKSSLHVRYSLIPKTNVSLNYFKEIKEVENLSAIIWSRPTKTNKDDYEISLTNWAIPRVRVTAKVRHTDVNQELVFAEAVNNLPDQTDEGRLDLTWLITPKITSFLSADVVRENTDNNLVSDGITEANQGKSLRQMYLASVSFMVNRKLSLTPTYTFLSYKQDRFMAWEDHGNTAVIDQGYKNEQTAHNFSINMLYAPVKRLDINTTFEYTVTDGTDEPSWFLTMTDGSTDGVNVNMTEVARFSEATTTEMVLRLDTALDLGRGWGLGLNLRYTDWSNDSYDNPSDGTFVGGLVKITKSFIHK